MSVKEEIGGFIIKTKTIPERAGTYADYPEKLHPRIGEALGAMGIERLYSHQAEMFSHAANGEQVVITTSTASGKTLSFLLPVLQKILEDPLSRAIFVYPTKALAADQLRTIRGILEHFGKDEVKVGVYDGDTQPAERTRIRRSANIILTNPEMLNASFLPNHSKYGFDTVFSNLKFVVVDELHSYRGAFGAHLSNVFRRLKRICRYYGAAPAFLCSSATVANPEGLAKTICGGEFTLIKRDGSPSAKKTFHIVQPPAIKGKNDQIYGRYSALSVATKLVPQLVEERTPFIAFGRSRRTVELVLKESRDRLDAAGFLSRGGSRKIAGYRGGYTPLERRDIEKKMQSGALLGLIATNALELGIDIGKLDSTVLIGYPGTRASFWQQTGRAGRGQQEAVNYLILEDKPFDQYIAVDPDWLFEQESEEAVVDPDNLLIQLAHIRSAAAELPLSMDDIALFPDLGEVIPVLLKAEEVKALSGRFIWDGPAMPSGDYSMRNMDRSRYKLVIRKEGEPGGHVVTEMDETQAFHELYPGAVYLHEGALYEIEKLDLTSRTAEGHPFAGDYYTMPAGEENLRILRSRETFPLGRTRAEFGDVNVNYLVTMFKKLQFHNHQNLGYETLTVPLYKEYDTEGCRILLPGNVVKTFRSFLEYYENGAVRNNHFEGLSHALRQTAMMQTMTAAEDIGSFVSNNAAVPTEQPEEEVSVFLYDKYEGGLGYTEKICERLPSILDKAIRMMKGCSCENGCPACVGDYTLDKDLVLWGLENLLEESPAPETIKETIDTAERPLVQKSFSFFRLPEEWGAFCREAKTTGDTGASFLKTVRNVQLNGHTLVLTVDSAFFRDWILEPQNKNILKNTIRQHAICPADMELEVIAGEDPENAAKKRSKLERKYEGLTS